MKRSFHERYAGLYDRFMRKDTAACGAMFARSPAHSRPASADVPPFSSSIACSMPFPLQQPVSFICYSAFPVPCFGLCFPYTSCTAYTP